MQIKFKEIFDLKYFFSYNFYCLIFEQILYEKFAPSYKQ